MKSAIVASIAVTAALAVLGNTKIQAAQIQAASCYSSLLSGSLPTLSAFIQSMNSNGTLVVNGVDTAQPPPATPFQFSWGDGSSTSGFFPQQHVYANASQNYVITVTATENAGSVQQFSFPVFFTAPSIRAQTLPVISFQIPSQAVQLQTHYLYTPPTDVTFFSDSSFPVYSRADMAYVLAAASSIAYAFANYNSFLLNGVFSIDMLENTNYGGGISYWYTTPMSVGYGPYVVNPAGEAPTQAQWYILFNEIGKDTTLNSPVSLPFGGNTDGDASEIYSETMGAIFSYAAGCHLVSNAASYFIGPDVALDIQNSLLIGAGGLLQTFNAYVAAGAPFSSWNPYNGGTDPTLGTVAALAWKFLEHAETQGLGYQLPTTRLMKVLQMFDASMLASYAPTSNTQAAATFRSTLMVTALSYAFSEDLRSEFESLNFPIDNATFEQLYEMATGGKLPPTVTVTPSSSSVTTSQALMVTVAVSGGSGNPTPTGSVILTSGSYTSATTALSSGSATISIPVGSLATGADRLMASYSGDGNYSVGNGIASVTVAISLTQQAITFVSLSSVTLPSPAFALSATASSGLPVSFASTTPAVCSVSGVTLTPIAAGTCTITATQPGNANYSAAAPVTQSFTIFAVGTTPAANFSELGIFRSAAAGFWLDLNQSTYNYAPGTAQFTSFGLPGDQPVAGDWTGSGVIRIGIFRQGNWYIDLNNNGVWDGVAGGDAIYSFGLPGDIAIPGDWGGTGVTKLGVMRCPVAPAFGGCTWYLDAGNKKGWDPATAEVYSYGLSGDLPVVNNWNGTGKADQIGVFRQGNWIVENVGDGVYRPSDPVYQYGLPGDIPVVGNWSIGPQRRRIGVYRNGTWFLDALGTNSYSPSDVTAAFGLPGDRPVVGSWTVP